jgi:hypothetical protein
LFFNDLPRVNLSCDELGLTLLLLLRNNPALADLSLNWVGELAILF